MSTKLAKNKYLEPIENLIKPLYYETTRIDANYYEYTGLYIINANAVTCINFPVEQPNGLLETMRGNINCVKQIFTRYNGESWSRIKWFGTWQGWRQIT